MAWIDSLSGFGNHNKNFHLNKTLIPEIYFGINTSNKCSQYPGVFITSPFRMFTDFWTSDLVFRRMVVHLRRMAFLNIIYSPREVGFCPPISKSSVGTPLFYFISWVYIYWITSVQTFTKIWVQVLFGWNDLNKVQKDSTKLLCYIIEQTVTVQMWAKMFLLVSCSYVFQYILCFMHGQGQRTKDIKEPCSPGRGLLLFSSTPRNETGDMLRENC